MEQDDASTRSMAPTNGSVQDEAKEGFVAAPSCPRRLLTVLVCSLAEQQARNVIKELERQLAMTETRLREVVNERSQLRRLLEDAR